MTVAPEPKTNELIVRLNALSADPRIIDPAGSDARAQEWRNVLDALEPLYKVDAREAWAVYGGLHSAAGDRDQMERGFKNSVKLGWQWHVAHNWMNNRVRLGMLSAAQELYVDCGLPTAGHFTEMLGFGYQAGCIQIAAEFSRKANAMHIPMDERAYAELSAAADLLKGVGVTDEDVGKHLDIAGEICLKHGFATRVHVHITHSESFFSGVTFAVAVPVSPQEAFDMNIELAEAEEAAGIPKHVECDVVFKAAA